MGFKLIPNSWCPQAWKLDVLDLLFMARRCNIYLRFVATKKVL
jgi:hypothetical protein